MVVVKRGAMAWAAPLTYWSVSEGGSGGSMELTQSGPIVTGVYGNQRGSFELKDARVNGTILRFLLIDLTANPAVRVGEVVMDPGGKSFKGNIGGIPVAGKFGRP